MQYINATFAFVIGFELSASVSVTLLRNRQGALPWLSILGLKLLQMHFYERQSECDYV